MTSEERKKLEQLEKRVNALVGQQELVLQRLTRLIEIIVVQQGVPQCTFCKSPLRRVELGSDHSTELWECAICGENQIKH